MSAGQYSFGKLRTSDLLPVCSFAHGHTGNWCKGNTSDFDSGDVGSSPAFPASSVWATAFFSFRFGRHRFGGVALFIPFWGLSVKFVRSLHPFGVISARIFTFLRAFFVLTAKHLTSV